METKPLVVESIFHIPKPTIDGFCADNCSMLQKIKANNKWHKIECCIHGETFEDGRCKPSKGCPWYQGGEDE